ncbi:hypothetical protein [Rhizobium sp. Leaf384]|uniref:hypothetical protein n=1 Tax=Rhizobium sp. Leaf384 TaxID=1736358 RepID=UPI0007842FB3|nr:hypothetical protein [Rhizobium sp. Leaf384]
MKSTPSSDQSNEEPDQQAVNSVFDFLYYDAIRISSFLAQFDPSGSLTQLATTERAHRSRKSTLNTQGAGSVGVLKGTISEGTDAVSEYGKQSLKTYDTRWANALAFLDYAEQHELLRRDLSTSGIGDLVVFSGDLSLFDLGILKKVWDMPAMRKTIIAGAKEAESDGSPISQRMSRSQRRQQGSSKKADAKIGNEAEAALEMLSVLPHSIQASISDENDNVWCTLREDSITVAPSDLALKHGMSIGNDWNIVGVLDANPDIDAAMNDGTPFEIAKQMVAGSKLGMLALLMGTNVIPAARAMLGRPTDAYGVTPLLLFRQISPKPGT